MKDEKNINERLAVRDLSFSYDGKKNIFESLDMDVEEGSIMCIVGPNGCGKTTLIDCLLGLHKPSKGTIIIGDRDVSEMKAPELASHMAYVPQGHKTTFGFTVLDIVTMGRTYEQKMFSPPGEKEKEMALESLRQVGMESFADRDYTKLSGGELQLVLVARAITQSSEILVMDEPTAHLDFRHELKVMEIVAELVRERGISVMMATHFLNQAYYMENAGVKTTVSLMHEGRFVKTGSPSDVLTEEHLKGTFGMRVDIVESDGRKYILPLSTK